MYPHPSRLKILLLLFTGLFFLSNKAVVNAQHIINDQRFATSGFIGGDYYPTKWIYNWGWITAIDTNFSKALPKHNVMVMIGSPSQARDTCLNNQPQYDIAGKPKCGGYSRIPKIAQALKTAGHESTYWAIGNEPDLNPYINPDDYARWYHAFSQEILRVDPTAHISYGGLFHTQYDYEGRQKNISTDVRHNHLINKEPGYFQAIIDLASTDFEKSTIKNNAWLMYFIRKYQDLYGQLPPIHWHNIHPYPKIYHQNQTTDPAIESQNYITSFRKMMTYLQHDHLPLIITEFSVLEPPYPTTCDDQYGYNGCIYDTRASNCPSNDADWSACQIHPTFKINHEYLTQMVSFFNSSKLVQRWHWFMMSQNTTNNPNNNWPSIMMYDVNNNYQPNTLAKLYFDLASEFADINKPTIEISNTMIEPTNFHISLSAMDTESGILEYQYAKITQSSLQWIDIASTAPTHTFNIPISETSSYIFRAKDAAGNYSETLKITITPPEAKKSDIDQDGDVDWLDYQPLAHSTADNLIFTISTVIREYGLYELIP